MEFIEGFGEIVVGTNEEFLLGFKLVPNEKGWYELEPTFTSHAHNGRIKQVAINDYYLVSGSTDEFIKIFNLNSRVEEGHILFHGGTVTCLRFHESGYLISGSEDGNIGIFKKGKWTLEQMMTGHKSGVNDIAIHPSGKLALSVSKDRKMITWDLRKGKKACVVRLKKVGEFVYWAPDGTSYVIISMNTLDIYKVDTGNVAQSIDFKDNIYCMCYLTDELIAMGGEKKEIVIYNLASKKRVVEWKAHESRTKSIYRIDATESGDERTIVSASSDGHIKIWLVDLLNIEDAPKLIGNRDTKCRIICIALRLKKPDIPEINGSECKEEVEEIEELINSPENNVETQLTPNVKFEKKSRPKNPKFEKSPRSKNPKFEKRPPTQNPKFERTPPNQNPKFERTPPNQNPKFEKSPPDQNPKFEKRPRFKNPKFEKSPPNQNPKFEKIPLPQNQNTTSILLEPSDTKELPVQDEIRSRLDLKAEKKNIETARKISSNPLIARKMKMKKKVKVKRLGKGTVKVKRLRKGTVKAEGKDTRNGFTVTKMD